MAYALGGCAPLNTFGKIPVHLKHAERRHLKGDEVMVGDCNVRRDIRESAQTYDKENRLLVCSIAWHHAVNVADGEE